MQKCNNYHRLGRYYLPRTWYRLHQWHYMWVQVPWMLLRISIRHANLLRVIEYLQLREVLLYGLIFSRWSILTFALSRLVLLTRCLIWNRVSHWETDHHRETDQTGITRVLSISQSFLGRISSSWEDIKYIYGISFREVANGSCLWLLKLWPENI